MLYALSPGLLLQHGLKTKSVKDKITHAEEDARRILEEARHRAETLTKEAQLEAKDVIFQMKSDFDLETKETRVEVKKKERWLIQKEENIDRKNEQSERRDVEIAKKEKLLNDREEQIEKRNLEYKELIEEQKRQLERISCMSSEQAKELLIRAMENEARYEGAKLIKRIEAETLEEAEKKAKKIISTAIQRFSGEFVSERTVSVVPLPGDEMKGRIIGREGTEHPSA